MSDFQFTVSIIVAVLNDNGIGIDGKLPFRIKEDMKWFQEQTRNSIVIMGRKTYESIPENKRPLKDRLNIVLTRSANAIDTQVLQPNLCFVESIDKVKEVVYERLQHETYKAVFVIGGQTMYEAFLPYTKSIYLTRVFKNASCDTFFPSIDRVEWVKTFQSPYLFSKEEQCEFQFNIYEKLSSNYNGKWIPDTEAEIEVCL